MIRKRIDVSVMTSLALMIIILLFFIIMTNGRMVSVFNIKALVDQSLIFILAGLGVVFVVAQGGADLSIGVNVGITSAVGTLVATQLANEFVIFPIAIVIGLVLGLINGILVGILRVPSFMATLAFLIGLRGLTLFIQQMMPLNYQNVTGGPINMLKLEYVKYPFLIVAIIVFHIILQYTKFGDYCKAIGENESVAINVGIPVAKMKIYAFIISGFMASIAGFFMIAKNGGTNNSTGVNLEIDVLIGIFVGGVLVTGGYGTVIPKLLIGCFTISVIKSGMVMSGWASTETMQSVEGILLIIILIVTMKIKKWDGKRSAKHKDLDEIESTANSV